MSDFLFHILYEHHNHPDGIRVPEQVDINSLYQVINFQNNSEKKCIELWPDRTLHTSYYIGVDWIGDGKAIFVAPKLNTRTALSDEVSNLKETDFIKMLFQCLKYPDLSDELRELVEIKWEQPKIEIRQKHDLLTPLLIVEFLSVLKIIVRKGLKKTYYKVESNLNSKVKGKILIARNIKENATRNKKLFTVCSYDEFGLNGLENRLLNRTLTFIKRYLPVYTTLSNDGYVQSLFNYISPAFEAIKDDVDINDVKHSKTSSFYKEYDDAIRLAKLILKRFSYNISNVEKRTIETNPFWVDMSKLFELYVLGLLRDKFKSKILYHPTYNKKELDFLLLDPPMVIDAKYKPRYQDTAILDDARQLSGYSRMNQVYDTLGLPKERIIDCVVIYPNQISGVLDLSDFFALINSPGASIREYNRFFKIGVRLPSIK
jgi:5-methylcytosine-specific restriction enzyme subunit McrC